MTPSNQTDYSGRGYLVPIGGAEEKFDNPEILDKFIDICGGKNARRQDDGEHIEVEE